MFRFSYVGRFSPLVRMGRNELSKNRMSAKVQKSVGDIMFSNGIRERTRKNTNRMVEWFHGAASIGHVGALNELGKICFASDDVGKAKSLFKKASEMDGDISEALYNLGMVCEREEEGEQEMVKYLGEAAKLGYERAIVQLVKYYGGDEVNDEFNLMKWMEFGTAMKCTKAMIMAALYFKKNDRLDNMVGILERAVGMGCREAMMLLGIHYVMIDGKSDAHREEIERLFRTVIDDGIDEHSYNAMAALEIGRAHV